MGKLDGKVAVVTGGSSGIGLATAKALVDEGAYVFVAGRREVELDKAAAEIGRAVTTVRADVADLDDLDRLWATVREEKGAVDVIVPNAAFVGLSTSAAATPEHFDRTFDTNVRGTFFTVQKGLSLLRDGGAIVVIGSTAAALGNPVLVAYAATKAALRSFTRSWAAELVPRGIRVNSVSPGSIDTPMVEIAVGDRDTAAEIQREQASRIPLGRLGRAEEVAAAVLFLASADSGFITGHNLVADGGETAI
jgi:NAD(P)-dependent dehydrogenase (short-subunit alcohol dehydrogenase family)